MTLDEPRPRPTPIFLLPSHENLITGHFLSHPLSSSLILSHPLSSSLILSDPLSSSLILSHPLSSSLILSDPLWSSLILSHPLSSSLTFSIRSSWDTLTIDQFTHSSVFHYPFLSWWCIHLLLNLYDTVSPFIENYLLVLHILSIINDSPECIFSTTRQPFLPISINYISLIKSDLFIISKLALSLYTLSILLMHDEIFPFAHSYQVTAPSTRHTRFLTLDYFNNMMWLIYVHVKTFKLCLYLHFIITIEPLPSNFPSEIHLSFDPISLY